MIEVRIARGEAELRKAAEIRRKVFVEELEIFSASDADGADQEAVHFVALTDGGETVGTVRINDEGGGRWVGSRLAVLKGYRGLAGRWLVRGAVAEVRARGGSRFEAKIQSQNRRFFERLGWKVVEGPFEYHGLSHFLMQAGL
jgi:putative N-acetyltransferase (TIGR04045 family)